jgi:hypothetical protein
MLFPKIDDVIMKMVTLSWYKLLGLQWQPTHCQLQCQELQEQERNSATAAVPMTYFCLIIIKTEIS